MTEPPLGDDTRGPRRRIRPYLQASVPAERPAVAAPPGHRVRPFVVTSGRVAGTDPHIGVESQVMARATGPAPPPLAPELRSILALCAEPISVAEISARLRLHLGVTQILVGDLQAAGIVDVHTVDIHQTHDPDLILRVIHGLRSISR